MKKADVQINGTYLVKVAGNLVPVKITNEHPNGGWEGRSVKTGKSIRIKSPQRLRRQLADAEHMKAVHKADQENARLNEQRAASADGRTASERAMADSAKDAAKAKRRIVTKEEYEAEARAEATAAGQPVAEGRRHAGGAKPMSLLDAAAHLLSLGAGDPMRCKDIVDLAVARGLWTPRDGKTPANTLYAAISREIKLKGDASRFAKAERGKFALASKT